MQELLNSRPLTAVSDGPNDDRVLTPNHFLIGQIGGDFVPESVDTESVNPRKALEKTTRAHKTCVEPIDKRILTANWIKTEVVLP